MTEREPILLVGFGEGHDVLAGRIVLFGMRALRADDYETATRLAAEGALRPRALLAPHDFATVGRAQVLATLRKHGHPMLQLVATGTPPDRDLRADLRRDGFSLCLWEPFTDASLRFVINAALRDPSAGERRGETRAPTDLMARVHGGTGEKPVLVYNLSVTGAFLETHRPNPPGAQLRLSLPLGEENVEIPVRVVHANVTGNLSRANLPKGMAVEFIDPTNALTLRLAHFVAERVAAFEL